MQAGQHPAEIFQERVGGVVAHAVAYHDAGYGQVGAALFTASSTRMAQHATADLVSVAMGSAESAPPFISAGDNSGDKSVRGRPYGRALLAGGIRDNTTITLDADDGELAVRWADPTEEAGPGPQLAGAAD